MIAEASKSFGVDSEQLITLSEQLILQKFLVNTEEPEMALVVDEYGPIYFHVTERCNLYCPMCYANASSKAKDALDTEGMNRIADILAANGVKEVVISGGEPLIRHDIFEILEHIRSLFRKVYLLTNGTLLSTEVCSRLVHLVDRVQVSLDGSCPEVHEKIRGRGTFAPTIQGIRNLKKAGMTDITIAFTLTRWNLHDVLNVSALSSGLGVDFSLNRFAPLGRGSLSRDLEVTPLEMLDVFKKLQQQSIKSGKAKLEYIYRQMAQPIRTSCGVGKSYFSVAQDGSIYPCHTLHEPQFLIGNILQKGDIRAMLGSSEVAQRFARLDVDHKEICKDCDVRYFCAGGCPANAYGYSGAIEALDPNCPFYKAVERALLIGWRYDRDLTQNIQKVMSELDREVKFAGRMEDQ